MAESAQRRDSGSSSQPGPKRGTHKHLGPDPGLKRREATIRRTDLEAEVAQRTRELTAAFEFSQEIVSQLHLQDLTRSVTDRARTLMGSEVAYLCLLTPDEATLELAASSGGEEIRQGLTQPAGCGLVSQVIDAGKTVVSESLCLECQLLQAQAPGECVAAPLRVGERVLGALCVTRPAGARFGESDSRALSLLANSAAIAIANARLMEAGRRQAEQGAILAERERLAAELHDHLAQTLNFVGLSLDRVEQAIGSGHPDRARRELRDIRGAVTHAYDHLRATLAGLSEAMVAVDGLAQALGACVDQFSRETGIAAELSMAQGPPWELPRLAQDQALHIVREALINVRRHAQARRVWVRVEPMDGELWFTVQDDGRGFDPQALPGGHHLGLTVMRARAERTGGRVTLEATPGAGARVVLRYPLTHHPAPTATHPSAASSTE